MTAQPRSKREALVKERNIHQIHAFPSEGQKAGLYVDVAVFLTLHYISIA